MTSTNITLTLIKPITVGRLHTGQILSHIEQAGFRIKALKMLQLPKEKAAVFYSIHRDKPFFDELVEFMCSGPLVAVVLEKENAVEDFRQLIGATNPKEAAPGTLRNLFGTSKTHNAVHGSDSDENAKQEISMFFSELELF